VIYSFRDREVARAVQLFNDGVLNRDQLEFTLRAANREHKSRYNLQYVPAFHAAVTVNDKQEK